MTDNCSALNIKAYSTEDEAINNPFYITIKNFETFEQFRKCWLKKEIAPGYYYFKHITDTSTGRTLTRNENMYCAGDKCPFSSWGSGGSKQGPTFF